MLLLLGLALCVPSAFSSIPPWSSSCIQHTVIPNACAYGGLTVTLSKKTLTAQDCNTQVSIAEFEHTPVIRIDTTNTTDMFTVVMIDLGPEGKGPNYLQWMVTNVTVNTLVNFYNIPKQNVMEGYKQPLLMKYVSHRTLIQILVLRHNNVLRINFGELWVKQIQNFSLSTLFSNVSPTLRLCGPVAGAQYWLYDPHYTPSAPPMPAGQPVQPVYVPVVPVIPVAQVPANVPAPPQHGHTTFPKRSSAPKSQPLQMIFIPLAVFSVMRL